MHNKNLNNIFKNIKSVICIGTKSVTKKVTKYVTYFVTFLFMYFY